MASLLNKTTSAQLGIGSDASDFATGVKKKKKKQPQRSHVEAVKAEVAATEKKAAIQAQQDVTISHDPRETDGQNFQMNTDDQAFINQVQDLKSALFAGNFKGAGGGRNAVAGFFKSADASSRGGLSDVWNDTIAQVYKGMGPKQLALAQESFNKAYEKTSQVLNLDVDMGSYTFDQGSENTNVYGNNLIKTEGKGKRKDFRDAKKTTRTRAKANEGSSQGASATYAWDIGADASLAELAIDKEPEGAEQAKRRASGGSSDYFSARAGNLGIR